MENNTNNPNPSAELLLERYRELIQKNQYRQAAKVLHQYVKLYSTKG